MATSRQLLEELVTASLNFGDSGEKSRAATLIAVLQQELSGAQLTDLICWLLWPWEVSAPALSRVNALVQATEPVRAPVRVEAYDDRRDPSEHTLEFSTSGSARIWVSKRVSDAIKDGLDARWASPRYAVISRYGKVRASYTIKYA